MHYVTHLQREYPRMTASCSAANTRKMVVDKQAVGGGQPPGGPPPPPNRWLAAATSRFTVFSPSRISLMRLAMSYPMDCTCAVGWRAWFCSMESERTWTSCVRVLKHRKHSLNRKLRTVHNYHNYCYYYLLQLSFHSVAVALTLVQTKQIILFSYVLLTQHPCTIL